MKRVLLVSDEEKPESLGEITMAAKYGLGEGLCDIPNLRSVIESLGEYRVETIHHTRIDAARAAAPDCVILSGRFSDRPLDRETMEKEYHALISWIPTAGVPVLGICMGLQLICAAFNVGTKRLENPEGEYGFTRLRRMEDHPLLEGMGESFHCLELHRCGAERVPEGFSLLASSRDCSVQMIAHQHLPLVGTQFHPELTTEDYRDGLRLLERFFRLCA